MKEVAPGAQEDREVHMHPSGIRCAAVSTGGVAVESQDLVEFGDAYGTDGLTVKMTDCGWGGMMRSVPVSKVVSNAASTWLVI